MARFEQQPIKPGTKSHRKLATVLEVTTRKKENKTTRQGRDVDPRVSNIERHEAEHAKRGCTTSYL